MQLLIFDVEVKFFQNMCT